MKKYIKEYETEKNKIDEKYIKEYEI